MSGGGSLVICWRKSGEEIWGSSEWVEGAVGEGRLGSRERNANQEGLVLHSMLSPQSPMLMHTGPPLLS